MTIIDILFFILGMAVAIGGLFAYASHFIMSNKLRKAEKIIKELEELLKKNEQELQIATDTARRSLQELIKTTLAAATPTTSANENNSLSVKDRLRKAVEIATQQSKINTKKDPESLVQHNELELEKLTILRTILKDGFDPIITIRQNTGSQEEMPLSEYVQSIAKGLV